MYGYVKPDSELLSIENTQIYFAHFCCLCKTAGRRHGQFSRFFVSYDITFLDIFMRSLTGENTKISEETCIANLRKKRKIADKTELAKLISDVSVLLAYQKLTDDITDGGGLKHRLARLSIRRAYKQARKAHSPLEGQIKGLYGLLRICERQQAQSVDAVSHYFAEMLSKAATYILSTQNVKIFAYDEILLVSEMFYNLGKWVYVIDAADDLEEDKKTQNFNPLILRENLDEAKFVLYCCAAKIAECYDKLSLTQNKKILDNIIYRGLQKRTEKILGGGKAND